MRSDDEFPEIDTKTASVARMYDYSLGGTDNYTVDREAMEAVEDMQPGAMAAARNNRRFLERVVRYLAGECGIRQFIDFGSGLPTQSNVHEVAQSAGPGSRVVYVDNDPVVLRHQRVSALLAEDKSTAFILEDARDVEAVLDHPDTQRLINFDEPVAVLLLSLLHGIPDADDPVALVRRAMDRLVPGSYLAISVAVSDDPEFRQWLTAFFRESLGGQFGRIREPGEVADFFAGLEIVDPGLVNVYDWRPDGPAEEQTAAATEFGGVGRKPA